MKKLKKWSVIIPVLVAAIMLISTPLTVLAQADEDTPDSEDSRPRGALAIIAPWTARVGQEFSMRVFTRQDQEPFEGAGVWALTEDEAEAMREEIQALNSDESISTEDTAYEELADIHGTLIGRTGEDGRLYHSFDEEGIYVLAAVKRGYTPGFCRIRIGIGIKALELRAPEKAMPGDEVLMTVYQRDTGEVVSGAGIWAVSKDNVEALRADMERLNADTSVPLEERDYQSVVDIHGTFLGRTDEYGNLTHIFEEEGGYLLIAVMRGYVPGRAPIRIGEPMVHQGLTIWAPLRALVDTEVTMTVYKRGTVETVDGAGVWAITRDQAEALREEISALAADSSISAEEKDYESLVNLYGFFIGRTDESGQVSCVFEETGDYILVAVKPGYIPGFSPIRIVRLPLSVTPQKNNDDSSQTDVNQNNNAQNLRANTLRQKGVQGKGIDNATGLQKTVKLRTKVRQARPQSTSINLQNTQ